MSARAGMQSIIFVFIKWWDRWASQRATNNGDSLWEIRVGEQDLESGTRKIQNRGNIIWDNHGRKCRAEESGVGVLPKDKRTTSEQRILI